MSKHRNRTLEDRPRDGKRTHRAKSATLARKRARATKRIVQGR